MTGVAEPGLSRCLTLALRPGPPTEAVNYLIRIKVGQIGLIASLAV